MDKVERQREHFNSVANEYYLARKNANHLRYKELLFSYVLKGIHVDKNTRIKVLEPMCGYGEGRKIVQRYLSDNIEYEGFDYSDVLVDEVNSTDPELNVYKQDVTQFDPQDKKYDVMILIGGLHHVPDYARTVCRKLAAGLKENGIFINFEPTNNNPAITLVREEIYKKNHLFDEETERAFKLKDYNRMFAEAGLKIEKQFYPGLLGYVMYYNPDAFPALNRGNEKTVESIFNLEKGLYGSGFGRFFSFCTFSIFRKSGCEIG